MIYAGGGVLKSGASEELVAFAEKAGIPVANSLMGLGCIPRDNPLSLGFVGMHGSQECNLAVINCDTLIAVGARFSDRVTGNINEFMRDKKIIHIDIDPTAVSYTHLDVYKRQILVWQISSLRWHSRTCLKTLKPLMKLLNRLRLTRLLSAHAPMDVSQTLKRPQI